MYAQTVQNNNIVVELYRHPQGKDEHKNLHQGHGSSSSTLLVILVNSKSVATLVAEMT